MRTYVEPRPPSESNEEINVGLSRMVLRGGYRSWLPGTALARRAIDTRQAWVYVDEDVDPDTVGDD